MCVSNSHKHTSKVDVRTSNTEQVWTRTSFTSIPERHSGCCLTPAQKNIQDLFMYILSVFMLILPCNRTLECLGFLLILKKMWLNWVWGFGSVFFVCFFKLKLLEFHFFPLESVYCMAFSLVFHMGLKVQVVPAGIHMIPISIMLGYFYKLVLFERGRGYL